MMKKFTAKLSFLFMALSWLLLPVPAYAAAATLSLTPSTGTFNRGCTFSLQINVNTGGAATDGTDAILIYDPTRLTATSISNGTIYSDYPGNGIDASTGKVTVSGIAPVSQAFTGTGVLATVNFTVATNAPTGAATVKIDFDPSNPTDTTDSNVVERGTISDVLTSVTDGNYVIGTGACSAQTQTVGNPGSSLPKGGVSTPSATTTPISTLPQGGDSTLTWILTGVGSILTVIGILGLALL